MRTVIVLGTTVLVGVVQYCKPTKPVVVTKTVVETIEVVKLVEVPKIIEVTKIVEKPILVKPLIQYVGPSYNFNSELLNGVKFFEGYRANAYKCCAGVKTIGYGCTDKSIVALGAISEHKASNILQQKINEVRDNVRQAVKVDLTEYQLNALTSFAYNCGMTNLKTLINGEDRLNNGNYESVVEVMPQYNKAGGKTREGLVKRRAWELSLWQGSPSI
jgi:lysozyme